MSAVINPLSRKGEKEIVFFSGNHLRPPSFVSSHHFIRNSGEKFPRKKLIIRLARELDLAPERLKHFSVCWKHETKMCGLDGGKKKSPTDLSS